MNIRDRIINLIGVNPIILKKSDNNALLHSLLSKLPNDSFPEREELFPLVEAFPFQQEAPFRRARRLYGRACHDSIILTNSKLVVELGTMFGLSSAAFLRALKLNNGQLISFDPNMNEVQYDWMPEGFEKQWTRHAMTGERGYREYKNDIKNIDMLYIDTDPHSYEQTKDFLNGYWVKNIRPGGYITMDDAAAHLQVEAKSVNFPGLFELGKSTFGVLRAILEFVDAQEEKLEYAYIIDTKEAKGFAILKFKEGVKF